MPLQTLSHTTTTAPHSPLVPTPPFTLTPIRPTSQNVLVRRYPLRVIAWGLAEGEWVSVQMARVQSLGNPHWAATDDCCPCVIAPDQVANVQHLPYQHCGKAVVLTAERPAIHIDVAGTYYFEYHGNQEVILDCYDDPVMAKNQLCDCAL